MVALGTANVQLLRTRAEEGGRLGYTDLPFSNFNSSLQGLTQKLIFYRETNFVSLF